MTTAQAAVSSPRIVTNGASEARPSRWTGPRLVVAAAALLSAVAAVVLSRLVFPHLSIDNDEPIYLLQARAIGAGHLFPAAPRPAASFLPWLAAVDHGHYVLKYAPVIPGIFAASLAVTGSFVPVLALLAAALVVTTARLAKEVFGDERIAAIAAVLVALSPLALVQSALLLPYLPSVSLMELTALGLLTGARRHVRWRLAGAGLTAGLAFAARPYDAVLFLLPLAAMVCWQARRERWLTGVLGWAAAGAVLPIAGLLAFDQAATGSLTKLPFSLLEPNDKIGFGIRQLYPTDHKHHFGIAQGLTGVGQHWWLLWQGWVVGGVVLFAAVLVMLARRRVPPAGVALAAGGLLLTVGYVGFWGAWNAASIWGGVRYVGPFYLFPLLVPLTLIGAQALVVAWGRRRWLAGLLVAACAASAVPVLVLALLANLSFTKADDQLAGALAAQGKSVVFVVADPPFLQHPSPVLDNGLSPGGRTVYAISRGAPDLGVADEYSGRELRRLRISGDYGRDPNGHYTVWLERLQHVTRPAVDLLVDLRPSSSSTAAQLIVTGRGKELTYSLPPHSRSQLLLHVTASDASILGLNPSAQRTRRTSTDTVIVTLQIRKGNSPRWRFNAADILVAPVQKGQVDTLAPAGMVARQGKGPDPAVQLRLVPPAATG